MSEHLARIQKLAARGMSAKQIAEELKTPRGEVELILRLQPEEEN
jgi:transcriptional regulator